MSNAVLGESVTFKIEVEDSPLSILLVFDRKCDYTFIPWQSAFDLAKTMDQVVKDVSKEFARMYSVSVRETVVREQAQMKLNHYKDLVVLMVEWTDRLRFTSLEAFSLCSRALRHVGQDAYLAHKKGIHFLYAKDGMAIKQMVNAKQDYTQIIPGR